MTVVSSLCCFNGLETGQHLGAGSQQRICPHWSRAAVFTAAPHTRGSLSFHPSMHHDVPAGQGCPPRAAEILATRHISHVAKQAFSWLSSQDCFPAGLRVVWGGEGKSVLHSTATSQCRYFSSDAGRCLGERNSSGLSCYSSQAGGWQGTGLQWKCIRPAISKFVAFDHFHVAQSCVECNVLSHRLFSSICNCFSSNIHFYFYFFQFYSTPRQWHRHKLKNKLSAQ